MIVSTRTNAGTHAVVGPMAAQSGAQSATKPPVVVVAKARPTVGTILVTVSGGATLYRDTNDGPNDPTCTGGCASIWPPLLLPAGDTMPRSRCGQRNSASQPAICLSRRLICG